MKKPKHLIITGATKKKITLDTTDGKRVTKADIKYVAQRFFKKKR